MKKNWKIILVIIFLTFLGGFLRFLNLTSNPPSLNVDEVSYGYNAYSILKTSRDEYGKFLPLTFKSTGDYKNPVIIYSMVPSIAVFGLSEFSVRFPTALITTLSIPIFFLFFYKFSKRKDISLMGTFLISISPWFLFYSRFASDHAVAMVLVMVGIYFFLKMLEGKLFWAPLSALFLILSMYTYHSERLLVPPLVLVLLILNWTKLPHMKFKISLFLGTCFLLSLPLLYLIVFGQGMSRAGMVFLSQDIDYTRYVILDHLQRGLGENFLLISFWIKRYLNYFQPDFLFFNGLNMTNPGSFGLGVLFLFELPWLVWGIVEIVKGKVPNAKLIVLWILLGIVPASLTNNEQSAGRSLIILPPLILISATGAIQFFTWLKKLSIIYVLLMVLVLIQAYLVFVVHFPLQKGEAYMEGTKEAVLYALENKNQYQEIVFDPKRGVEYGDVVSVPHMYILFYSQYDPAKYQTEVGNFTSSEAHFNKFTIRDINWRDTGDQQKRGTLFIGSPWSLPEKELKKEEILKRIYLKNGRLAFFIATPKR
ncbi:MAG: glycosyltransferase family 39 protein [Candidatus Daviesbacteria bacterium]|nr:glycosyltransferase family 39 protein [Candidatus Daviesbacteria bacterium]